MAWFSGFSIFRRLFLDSVYKVLGKSRLRGYQHRYVGSYYLEVPDSPPLLGVLGVWMTFKKAAMAKTLRNGLIMSEMGLPITNGWILRFSWDWHCTSFKKTTVKFKTHYKSSPMINISYIFLSLRF